MQRNLVGTASGKCGIAMEASYPIKKGQNPPNPGPSPPSPIKPPTVCDSYYSCPQSSTCCCVYEYGNYCFAWGCCPLEAATCCDDHYSCCPHDYPICNVRAGTCLTVRATKPYFVVFLVILSVKHSQILISLLTFLTIAEWLRSVTLWTTQEIFFFLQYITYLNLSAPEQEQPTGSEGNETHSCRT